MSGEPRAGKMPAFQFYPADWRKDLGVQALSYHDRGVWFEILCLMHESEQRGRLLLNGQAMPTEVLARVLGLDVETLTSSLTKILSYGVADIEPETKVLVCRRMVRDEELRNIRIKCGKMGGNPRLLNQTETTRDNQKSTPSSSSSSSSSDISERPGEAVIKQGIGDAAFVEVYGAYPKKVGRKAALNAIKAAAKKYPVAHLLERTKAYAAAVAQWPVADQQYVPYPATWFNRESFEDDPATWARGGGAVAPAAQQPARLPDNLRGFTNFSL